MAKYLEAAGHYLICIEDTSVCFSFLRVILESPIKYYCLGTRQDTS
jgi:hypothetical protein